MQLASIRLPQIGTIKHINEDGTCEQGPIPGLGGPFDTASKYFKAWSAKSDFGLSDERLEQAAGEYAAEVKQSVSSFRKSMSELADRLSIHDNGPFPLQHGDFGHNNVIVDADYRVLGVIDWEFASAVPWEIAADFSLNITSVPRAMDVPWNWDEQGNPLDVETRDLLKKRREYVEMVVREEQAQGDRPSDLRLSTIMQDPARRDIATSLRLYRYGKAGFYAKLIDEFCSGK